MVRVRVSEQRTDGEKELGNCQGWAPLLLQDVKANVTIGVDVWMVNLSESM